MKHFPCRRAVKHHKGFTLVELLAVMSIIILMLSVAIPGVSSLRGAYNLSQSASDLAGTLELARSRAMAKNTYVFVGISETDNRLTIAMVESKDGSNNYNANGDWKGDANLAGIGRIKTFDGVHMTDFSGLNANSGPMASRRTVDSAASLGNSSVGTRTVFSWPLGTASTSTSTQFSKVIQFNPGGVATLQNGVSNSDFLQRMEIALQKVNGKDLPATVTDISIGKIAAVQLDGVTGITRIYQP